MRHINEAIKLSRRFCSRAHRTSQISTPSLLRLLLVIGMYVGSMMVSLAVSAQEDEKLNAEDGVRVTVSEPFVEIRTGPGRGYPIFHVAERHEALVLLKRRTDWYKVAAPNGKTGWVNRDELAGAQSADGTAASFTRGDWQNNRDNHWEIGLHGGTLSAEESLNLHLGYRVTTNFSTEVRYSQAFGDFADVKLASVNLVHQLLPEWRWSPFITVGVGAIRPTPDAIRSASNDEQDAMVNAGVGAVFYATRHFALRLEYNHHLILTNRDDNEEVEEWKAGFSVSF